MTLSRVAVCAACFCQLLIPESTSVTEVQEVNPAVILEQLNARKTNETAMKLCESTSWPLILLGVSSGTKDWLDVAVALEPVADGHCGFGLMLAFGGALERAPERVLRIARAGPFNVEDACANYGIPKSQKREEVEKVLDRRVKALESVHEVDLQSTKAECLKQIAGIRERLASGK